MNIDAEKDREDFFIYRLRRAKQIQIEVFGAARAYDTLIVGLGFGSLLGLLLKTRDLLPEKIWLAGAALTTISIAGYVAFYIIQVIWSSAGSSQFFVLAFRATNLEDFDKQWAEAEAKVINQGLVVMKIWPYCFFPSVMCGVLSALFLAISSLWIVFTK